MQIVQVINSAERTVFEGTLEEFAIFKNLYGLNDSDTIKIITKD